MIGQITPLVKVAGRRVWSVAALAHVSGATLSAGALGLVLGTVGLAAGFDRSPLPLGGAAAAVLIVCAVRDAGLVRVALPSLLRQTPRWLRSHLPPWSALLWGIDLGQGWTTRIQYTGFYGIVTWALLGADPTRGAILLGCYGLGRALPVVLAGAVWSDRPIERILRSRLFDQPLLQQVNAGLLMLAGIALIGIQPTPWR